MALSKEEQKQFSQGTVSNKSIGKNLTNKKSKKWLFAGIIFFVVIILVSFSIVNANTPGHYDKFAKCLTEKDAVIYGASWCKYTDAQKAMFGKSFKHLDYIDYSEFPERELGKIKKTPTWIINGKAYENVLSFDRLSQLSGCKI